MTSIQALPTAIGCHVATSTPAAARQRRFDLGPPILSLRAARSARRFAVANAVILLLAGWLSTRSSGIYDQKFGWMAVGLYLSVTVAVQLMSNLPTVRRVPTAE